MEVPDMKRAAVMSVFAVAVVVLAEHAVGQAVPAESQIVAASLAAPADRREGATVLGYDATGKLVTLRRGANDLICLADDPERDGFETACYHESLEPFMARGRELTAAGVTGQDRIQTRYREAEAGTLKMPEQPAMLYILTGASFDTATGTVANEYRRSTIYIPYATSESTGLSPQASETDPWIMFPGTPGAHIMITPARVRSGSG
jgi:hypothetical protein